MNVLRKLVETAISVKVIVITVVLSISTNFVYLGLMSGAEWGMVNGGVISTVFALREAFKIARVNEGVSIIKNSNRDECDGCHDISRYSSHMRP